MFTFEVVQHGRVFRKINHSREMLQQVWKFVVTDGNILANNLAGIIKTRFFTEHTYSVNFNIYQPLRGLG